MCRRSGMKQSRKCKERKECGEEGREEAGLERRWKEDRRQGNDKNGRENKVGEQDKEKKMRNERRK